MPWKVMAVKNGRELMSDATYQHRELAESYANQAKMTGCQEAKVVYVDDIQARKLKRARASGL